jgi:hypothetical protein
MADFALDKHLLAKRRVLRSSGTCRTRKCEGGENVNRKIFHWPIRSSVFNRMANLRCASSTILSGSPIEVKLEPGDACVDES